MKIIAGNWKMNGTREMLDDMVAAISQLDTDHRVILCVPYTMLRGGDAVVMIGAQNVSKHESGAHTGEISAQMVYATGATATLVGHSEARAEFRDTNPDVAKRAEMAISGHLLPIICVGETAAERERGLTHQIIEQGVMDSVPSNATSGGFIIAYEPRWAIGAGITPTQDEIAVAHKIVRNTLEKMGYTDIPILYGASVTAENAAEIMSIENVDGVLVGGASLKKDDFIPIIQSVK